MLRIDIEDKKVTEKKGTAKSGNAYSIREQNAYAHLLDRNGDAMKYPVAITVTLQDKAEPYEPGEYTLADGSFMTGKFGQLELGRVSLVRMPKPSAAKP